ncbi:uncharacterized protein LOC111694535 [Trichogramma pretiosum]|uniref:uncharacterized protein LOC111694535 n=1 Tax=Trichogramma pretiosum TaxID=7493 RepID=UPI000C71A247|nr:uncharacterized protein LOC111694535 [Trichogramma pretiosum]
MSRKIVSRCVDLFHGSEMKEMRSLRRELVNNWEIEDERNKLFEKFGILIGAWQGSLPKLRDVFEREEIDWLLSEDLRNSTIQDDGLRSTPIVDFAISAGYRDEPALDRDGAPILLRTTPLHHLAGRQRSQWDDVASKLFRIYDRFEANYVDVESDRTHFHVACEFGCEKVVEKFLVAGRVDPDCRLPRTGDPALYLALRRGCRQVLELLLRHGANPNLSDAQGSTPLHLIARSRDRFFGSDRLGLMRVFFEIRPTLAVLQRKSEQRSSHGSVDSEFPACLFEAYEDLRFARINDLDGEGNSALHLALLADATDEAAEFLLRRGADPNLANRGWGWTALHVLCARDHYSENLRTFLAICDEIRQPVQLEVRDNFDRSPLEWAVSNCLPDAVDVLLDRGAQLTSFVFPAERFARRTTLTHAWRLRLAGGALACIERLQIAGYDFQQAQIVMDFFCNHGMIERSRVEGARDWYNDEDFVAVARACPITRNLSLDDLIRLSANEAAGRLELGHYRELAESWRRWAVPDGHAEACVRHLCEKASRPFFRRWALYPFWYLMHQRLPVELCERIIENLSNEDFYGIVVAQSLPNNDR